MSEILKVTALEGGIDSFDLHDISFSLERGSVMGLLGCNGAGKTTLIKTLIGFYPRYGGEVLFDGLPMRGNEVQVKSMLGVVLDESLHSDSERPRRLVKQLSPFYPRFNHERFDGLMSRFDLPDNKKLGTYSKGMRAMFDIIMALSCEPDLVIMDEPTAGLDPSARRDILDVLHEFVQDERKSVLLSTHITSDLERIADYVTVLDNGRVRLSQSVLEVTEGLALCRLAPAQLTEELARFVVGARETVFGLECLVSQPQRFSHIDGLSFGTPCLEDVLTHPPLEEGWAWNG